MEKVQVENPKRPSHPWLEWINVSLMAVSTVAALLLFAGMLVESTVFRKFGQVIVILIAIAGAIPILILLALRFVWGFRYVRSKLPAPKSKPTPTVSGQSIGDVTKNVSSSTQSSSNLSLIKLRKPVLSDREVMEILGMAPEWSMTSFQPATIPTQSTDSSSSTDIPDFTTDEEREEERALITIQKEIVNKYPSVKCTLGAYHFLLELPENSESLLETNSYFERKIIDAFKTAGHRLVLINARAIKMTEPLLAFIGRVYDELRGAIVRHFRVATGLKPTELLEKLTKYYHPEDMKGRDGAAEWGNIFDVFMTSSLSGLTPS